MRRRVVACFVAAACAVFARAEPAAALTLSTSIDLDYSYAQTNLGGDVEATTAFNQKYEIRYETSLTTVFDFVGAVRLELQDAWFTNEASTSRAAPTLEVQVKGSQLAAKFAVEAAVESLDAYQEEPDSTTYSSSVAFDVHATPAYWPELKFRFQNRADYQEAAKESTSRSFEFSAVKDIYNVRLEYSFSRGETDNVMPARTTSGDNKWSAKVAYKEVLWFDTEFEFAYELNESYSDSATRGVFSGESQSFKQTLRTRFRNTLVIEPRLVFGLVWEYQFEQDLLAVEFDYNVKNKYGIDMRWEPLGWLRFNAEAKRETEHQAEVGVEEDERNLLDTFKGAVEMKLIPWMQLFGKAELKKESEVVADSGGSVAKDEEEKYEFIAKNRFGDAWDFVWDVISTDTYENDVLTNRETVVKGDLKLKFRELTVSPGYLVSRTNEWERRFDYPVHQQQVRSANIKFEYRMQLVDLLKATFSHEYGVKVDDSLDAQLNFERLYQFNENTRLSVLVDELVKDVILEGSAERRASDTENDTDAELVELTYMLKLDWKLDQLSVMTTFRYNDKGDTFDDLSFSARAGWTVGQLEMAGEYQYDKVIKDITEPKDEKRKLTLRLRYKF